MKATTQSAILGALLATLPVEAAPKGKSVRDVDTRYPYTGPAVPIGDWVDQTVNGNGKGFPRLVEAPAVTPSTSNPTNNVNVISLSYVPGGVNIHYQTPFGIGQAPTVRWGTSSSNLTNTVTGKTTTYDRTPPCSAVVAVTQCSQFFHDVQISGLKPGSTYYYQIPATNGTTESTVLSFTTARQAGDKTAFTMAILNDMGYTNAQGTHKYLSQAVDDDVAFAWHGGDISYADDWYSGILPCASDWPVCYNGSSSSLPGGKPYNPFYVDTPLPAGEIPDQGGPLGGDMSVLYESNWDLWQQWMNNISTKVPYMVVPGNHEAACAEFDGPNNELTAYLVDDEANATVAKTNLTYYSCPPSQRNFTTYQHRFRMPGAESGGQTNFWYSFDYGLAHFVALDGETDFAYSPEWPFARDVNGEGTEVPELPTETETFITDSGPFGYINGNWSDNNAYEQVQWLKNDLASVNRTQTPWVIAMSHRPMYSSETATYQRDVRDAFEGIMLQYGVDAYFSGHIHWYERIWPIGKSTIDTSSIVNNNTYLTNEGTSMLHIVNGMAGNIESHSTISNSSILNITAVLDQKHYGFSKITFHNESVMTWDFIRGLDGLVGDQLTLIKRQSIVNSTSTSASTSISTGFSTSTASSGSSASATSSSESLTSTAATTGFNNSTTSAGHSASTTSSGESSPSTSSSESSSTSKSPYWPGEGWAHGYGPHAWGPGSYTPQEGYPKRIDDTLGQW